MDTAVPQCFSLPLFRDSSTDDGDSPANGSVDIVATGQVAFVMPMEVVYR
jgi:hypothetical protein